MNDTQLFTVGEVAEQLGITANHIYGSQRRVQPTKRLRHVALYDAATIEILRHHLATRSHSPIGFGEDGKAVFA